MRFVSLRLAESLVEERGRDTVMNQSVFGMYVNHLYMPVHHKLVSLTSVLDTTYNY